MKGIKYFTPNKATHQAFAEVLVKAENAGVNVMAYDCNVTEDGLTMYKPVQVWLNL